MHQQRIEPRAARRGGRGRSVTASPRGQRHRRRGRAPGCDKRMDRAALRRRVVLRLDMVTKHGNMMRQQLALDVAEGIRHLHVLLHDLVRALHGHRHILTTYERRSRGCVLPRCMKSMRGTAHLFFEGNALLHILERGRESMLLLAQFSDALKRKELERLSLEERVRQEQVVEDGGTRDRHGGGGRRRGSSQHAAMVQRARKGGHAQSALL